MRSHLKGIMINWLFRCQYSTDIFLKMNKDCYSQRKPLKVSVAKYHWWELNVNLSGGHILNNH
jgi:hypothetical protein